jgi:protein-tyrosine-phosphatase
VGAKDSRPTPPQASNLLLGKCREELEAEFGDVHPSATIDRVFEDSLAAFSDAEVEDYVPTLAQRIARDRLRALGQVAGTIARDRPEIVFVGLEGRGRSLMAAGLAELRSDGSVNVVATGTRATAALDANVIAAMAEIGIDLNEVYAKPLSGEVLDAADVVVTLGRSVVEVPETAEHEDWRVGDPVGAPLTEVRRIRHELEARVEDLLARLGASSEA